MKKIFLLILAVVMLFTIAACGGEPVTMVDVTTEQGISLKLPNDMKIQENLAYTNGETSDVATFGVINGAPAPYSEWSEEDFVDSEFSNFTDVVVESFENNKQINGNDALVCKYTGSTQKGNAITGAIVLVTDGINEYITSFIYLSDNTDGSLAKNLQSCIDSIAIAAK